MNLMRTFGGNSSRFCESPLSASESSVSMVISCMLNVSLRSTLRIDFGFVGKNGDENSSSSLLKKSNRFELCSEFYTKKEKYVQIYL